MSGEDVASKLKCALRVNQTTDFEKLVFFLNVSATQSRYLSITA